MKFRTIFVSERRQVTVPDGWRISNIVLTTPPRGKPQFAVLLQSEEQSKPQKPPIGFRMR